MEKQNRKLGIILIVAMGIVALAYQCIGEIPLSIDILKPIAAGFNFVVAGVIAWLFLKDEFKEWFKHFSILWAILAVPVMFICSLAFGLLWKMINSGHIVGNSVESILTWKYVMSNVPFMIMGEEILSITILYAAWKKIGLKFWQASLLCGVLFALWHLPAYGYSLGQVLLSLTPIRLLLNYIYKKKNSIWTSWLAHLIFDIIAFMPVLIKH